MTLTTIQRHVLWRETNRVLDSLAQAVREAKRVDEASNFCRWLRFSGVLQILQAESSPAPLMVDGKALAKKVGDVLDECGELYRGGKHDPRYAASDIAEINRKLDVIAAHIASTRTFSPAPTSTATAAESSAMPEGVETSIGSA